MYGLQGSMVFKNNLKNLKNKNKKQIIQGESFSMQVHNADFVRNLHVLAFLVRSSEMLNLFGRWHF